MLVEQLEQVCLKLWQSWNTRPISITEELMVSAAILTALSVPGESTEVEDLHGLSKDPLYVTAISLACIM